MSRRFILLIVAAVLLLGAVLVVARVALRRDGGPAAPPPAPGDGFPSDGAPPAATTSPAPLLFAACPDTWAGLPDGDSDGLPDQVEARYLTNEGAADTDGDGFNDGDEVRNGYHPLQKEGNPRLDSDGDGLFENEECQWRTDPFNADTDGDGFRDGDEVKNEFDPSVKGDGQGSDALPARRARQAQQAVEQLRPRPDSPNYTEGLAAILTEGTPTEQLGQTRITPEQVEEVIRRARLNTALPDVPLSDLKVGSSNTAADVRTYLSTTDGLRPRDLSDQAALTNALTAATNNGDLGGLRALRARITSYEQTMRGITVPPSGAAHHRMFIAVLRFTNDRLGEVEQGIGGGDTFRAGIALRTLMEGLPRHLQELQNTRASLSQLAQ